MSPVRTCMITSLCLLLAGCGFSLRSNDILAAKFSALQLLLEQPNSEISRLLRNRLEIAAIDTGNAGTNDTQNANPLPYGPVLHLGGEQLVSRPVSVNPRARAAQYELRMAVVTTLTMGDEVLIGPETLLVERSYFEDIENIAGTQEELEIIASEMRRELVNQLLRRLEAVNIQDGNSGEN